MKIVIAAVVLLMLTGAAFADVYNVNLTPVSNSGVSGTATTLSGNYGGITPHSNVEVNARMSQAPPSNMVYEAWLVDNESNIKQSIGVFNGNQISADLTATKFGANSPWDAIAVSTEPANDTNPMPGRIVAMGNLPGSSVSSADFDRVAVLPQDEMFQRQLAMQRFNLTSDQVASLRMHGLSFRDINLIGNIAMNCNQPPMQVAQNYVQTGADLVALSNTCNTTVAQLLTPAPFTAVAGYQGTVTPTTPTGPTTPYATGTPYATTMVPNYYLTLPNGKHVLTYSQWRRFHTAGYTWQEVATAANISAQTGVPVGDILSMTRLQGTTFQQIAMRYNLNWNDVRNVDQWPWERDGEMMTPSTPGTAGTAGPTNQGNLGNQGTMENPNPSPGVPSY